MNRMFAEHGITPEVSEKDYTERPRGSIDLREAFDDLWDGFLQRHFTDETVKVRQEKYLHLLESVLHHPESFMDRGGAADVFHFGDSGVCIKLARQRHGQVNPVGEYNLGNTVCQEASIQDRFCGFIVDGVYVPDFIQYIPGSKYGIIVMKELDAVNLQHVLNGTQELPDSFDKQDFLDRLESFIGEMHAVVKVVHGDLEARNIMIDCATGHPRLIDFGRSHVIDNDTDADHRLQRQEWDQFDALAGIVDKKLTK